MGKELPEAAQEALRRSGQKVSDERQRQQLSQHALAERVGIRSAAISRIERGLVEPWLTTRLAIAKALGVPHDDLFGIKEMVS